MAQYVQLTDGTYDLGLVTFQTEDGAAMAFAEELSRDWEYPQENNVYLVLGCRWAAAMQSGDKVIAAVRTPAGELDAWVQAVVGNKRYRSFGVSYIGSAVEQYFKDGRLAAAGLDGGP